MRRLILFVFPAAVVLASVGLLITAYRGGLLPKLEGFDWRERFQGNDAEIPEPEPETLTPESPA
jgi:hypothetical protein